MQMDPLIVLISQKTVGRGRISTESHLGLPADSLQNNSNSLQRNSNITAAEFRQFQ
jgi:hypothetical protein